MLTVLLALLVAFGGGDHSAGFAGPANRWTTRGGGPTRSGATLTRPVRGPVEVVWTHDAGGEIESEPLVWDERIVIAVKVAKDQRVLRVLDLATGERSVGDVRVKVLSPLAPSLWRNVVVFRRAATQVAALRIGANRMTEVWSHRSEFDVGPPLLVGNHVYLTTTGGLCKFALGQRAPLWKLDGAFQGEVALRPRKCAP